MQKDFVVVSGFIILSIFEKLKRDALFRKNQINKKNYIFIFIFLIIWSYIKETDFLPFYFIFWTG